MRSESSRRWSRWASRSLRASWRSSPCGDSGRPLSAARRELAQKASSRKRSSPPRGSSGVTSQTRPRNAATALSNRSQAEATCSARTVLVRCGESHRAARLSKARAPSGGAARGAAPVPAAGPRTSTRLPRSNTGPCLASARDGSHGRAKPAGRRGGAGGAQPDGACGRASGRANRARGSSRRVSSEGPRNRDRPRRGTRRARRAAGRRQAALRSW